MGFPSGLGYPGFLKASPTGKNWGEKGLSISVLSMSPPDPCPIEQWALIFPSLFAADTPFLFPFMSLTRFNYRWVLASLIPLLHAQAVSLYSAWVTWVFLPLLLHFLFLALVRSSLFIHAGLLPPLLDFLHLWYLSCTFDTFLSLEELEILSPSLKILNITTHGHFSKGCPWPSWPQQFFLVYISSSRVPPFLGSSVTCVKKLSSMCSRDLLDWLCPLMLPFDQVAEDPMKTRTCKQKASASCLKKASSTSSWSGSL